MIVFMLKLRLKHKLAPCEHMLGRFQVKVPALSEAQCEINEWDK